MSGWIGVWVTVSNTRRVSGGRTSGLWRGREQYLKLLARKLSAGTGENDGYIIRLFGAADPIRHRVGNRAAYNRKRLKAMLFDYFDQAFLTEFPGFVFRLRDTVAKCDKHIAFLDRDC